MKSVNEMTVGEVAKRAGVAVSTLHFYETKGLITSRRNAGNQRQYDRSVLRRVSIIRVAQQAGLPLSEIKAHLDTLPNKAISIAEWRELSREWRDMLTERIDTLIKLRDQMDGCIGCGCLSLRDCPLRNPGDILAKEGAGPHFLPPEEVGQRIDLDE